MTWLIIALLLAKIVFGALLYKLYLKPRLKAAREYIKLVSTAGYIGPEPTPRAVRNLVRVMRFLTFLQVGRVKVIGAENLDKPDGPWMFSANHPHWVDAAIIPMVLNRPARYMAHETVFQAGFGLGALLCAPAGAFVAHDSIRDNGVRARAASVKVLTSGQTLVLLPEGLTNFEPTMLPLKDGAVRILKEAARQLGKTTYIVPAYTRYGKYPGAWIQKYRRPIQYLLVFLMLAWYRRGATMVIGKPIASTELPDDDAAATELLRQRIMELDPGKV